MKATFGAGCFWCIEHVFRKVNGVTSTTVGYMGGTTKNPTYEEVCTDTTGHAEVVQVDYDPDKISYNELLQIFWTNHDPTTLNRQGPDIGKQYRSAIFFHTHEQQQVAIKSKDNIEKSGKYKKIVTEVTPASEFYKAEEYHQQYYTKCGIV